MTFDKAAAQFITSKQREFKNVKHRAQWASTLETYASPVLGNVPADQIELAHIVKVLDPIWITKTETSTRQRGRIESVLAYAMASGFRVGDNPARWRGNLDVVPPKPRKVTKAENFPALPFERMPEFMADLRQRDGIAVRALEFAILTAARSGEVRGATWDEIDLDAKRWTIPAKRMKADRAHVVPLCASAVRLLKQLPRMEGNDHILPAPRGGKLSDMAMTTVARRMHEAQKETGGYVDTQSGRPIVPHGFRSTFRDWTAERTSYPRDVAEMALAHTIRDKVEAPYRRGDLLAKRTHLMDEWCKFCSQPVT